MNILEYVGERIRALREAYAGGKGISQEALAKSIGLAANTISRWETATYRPSLDDLEKLARFFKVSILEFFPREELGANDRTAALLRVAKELPDEDLDELRKYAEYRQARHLYSQSVRPRAGRKRNKLP